MQNFQDTFETRFEELFQFASLYLLELNRKEYSLQNYFGVLLRTVVEANTIQLSLLQEVLVTIEILFYTFKSMFPFY